MPEDASPEPGFRATLRRFGVTLLAVARNRLELLLLEVQEERLRVFHSLLLVAMVLALGLFTLITAGAALVVVLWKNYGVYGLWMASLIGLVATLTAYFSVRNWLESARPFSATLEELKKDGEWLKGSND